MPDVGRSDSQRSDSSQRPRVSFNRDVHVKRIGHGGGPRVVGALAGDGEGHLVALPVRRERPTKLSRRELAEEARRVLQQADSVTCTSRSPLGYSTLPPVRSHKTPRRSLSFREKKDTRVTLSRSASDASKSSNKLSTSSLERRKKNKSHSDHSDSSPVRPNRHILKKSHSDSESAPHVKKQLSPGDINHKKQLSPIIEASPREDYFEPADEMLHSSQIPASRPALTKGRTVDAMVKRLSEDRTPRRPPRGVSPSALLSPGDGRQHNNNLPFSYTEPTQQVIYAEVVVSGGGPKQTVHTAVSQPHSDDDEGLGLTMESARGRADGMDSRRKELITEGYFQPRVGDGFDNYKTEYRSESRIIKDGYFGKEKEIPIQPLITDGYDNYKTEYRTESRVIKDGYIGKEKESSIHIGDGFDSYKTEYRSESSRIINDGYFDKEKEPPIQPRIIDSNDLSSRRDRLESRIESQRKDRLMAARLNDSSYKKHQLQDNGRSYNNRREFLHSQLNYEQESSGKKEMFADSGIEVDSPKEGPTAKIVISSPQVTRVDLNGHPSDGDETDTVDASRYSYSTSRSRTQLSSTKLVQEQRRVTDSVPSSTVLIRHYTEEQQPSLTDDDFDRRETEEVEPQQAPRKEKSQGTLKKEEKKKAPKKKQVSTMDKVKQLFSRSSNSKKEKKKEDKKEEKKKEPEEDPLTARYTEYKGSPIESDQETLTPLSQHHSPLPHRSPLSHRHREYSPSPPSHHRKEHSPSPPRHRREHSRSPSPRHHRDRSPPSSRHHREHSPPVSRHFREHSPPPSRHHREHSPPPSRHRRDHSPPQSRHHRDHSPPPSRHHRESSPSPPSRHHRERSPSPPSRHHRERSPSPLSRHQKEHTPSPPSRYHRDPSPSPLTHRYRDHSPPSQRHSPPSRYRSDHSREPSPHMLRRRDQPSPVVGHRQQLLQVPLKDHSSTNHRWISSDTEDRQQVETMRTRQRLATPTPSPSPKRATSSATLNRINNNKNKEKEANSGGWFKSLDRLTRKNKPKAKIIEKETEDERPSYKQTSENKNLRFFGDTDQESVTSIPPPMPLQTHRRYKSNSNVNGSANKQQVPRNPPLRNHRRHHRSAGDVATSSAESTTEGDSSQQSQRSVVYLHAATVGDIPTPIKRNVARRAQSREELSSVTSSHLQPQTRTISRSISVLAPWKPRHPREALEVHYDKEDNNKNYVKNGKPPKVPVSQQTSLNSSTMNRINRRKNAENNKQRVSRAASIESLKGRGSRSSTGLHPSTSIESLSRSVHSRDRKNASVTDLNRNHRGPVQKKVSENTSKKSSGKVSRSASMPKDNRVTAGWFKLRNKKQGT
ncbi:serine/arginine repetitive matrix protein 2 [Anabrus simplex]|uniref:serine/arginine repetitive matrix protein 2 n=1 Tax=Anabrus simplex TaxID=316456 RepID=UPI0035A2E87F